MVRFFSQITITMAWRNIRLCYGGQPVLIGPVGVDQRKLYCDMVVEYYVHVGLGDIYDGSTCCWFKKVPEILFILS